MFVYKHMNMFYLILKGRTTSYQSRMTVLAFYSQKIGVNTEYCPSINKFMTKSDIYIKCVEK